MVNRRIIIPRGAVDPNRTNVIEIPFQLQNEPHLIAKPSADGTGSVGVLNSPWDEDLANVTLFDAVDIPTYRRTNTTCINSTLGTDPAYTLSERPSYQRYGGGGGAVQNLAPREASNPPVVKPSKNYYQEVEPEPSVAPPPLKPATPKTNYYKVVDPATGQTYWAPAKIGHSQPNPYDYDQYNNYYYREAPMSAAPQPLQHQAPMESPETMQ